MNAAGLAEVPAAAPNVSHVPGLHLFLRTGEVHVMRRDRRRLRLHFNELDLHVVRRHRVGDAAHGPAFDDADVALDLNVGGRFGGGDDRKPGGLDAVQTWRRLVTENAR